MEQWQQVGQLPQPVQGAHWRCGMTTISVKGSIVDYPWSIVPLVHG